MRDKHADTASNQSIPTGSDGFMPETNLDKNTDDDVLTNMDNTNEQETETNQYHIRGGMKLVTCRKPKIIRSVRFYKEEDPENYFRDQLMLYTPWRKETTDLQGDCQSYQERFEQLEEKILCNREQYEYHSEMLDKALVEMNNEECPQYR